MKKYISRIGAIAKTGDRDFLEIVRHSSWAIILLVAGTGLQFIFDLVLARSFGASGSGLFYLSLSVLTTLALLGRLGLDRAVIRFMPPFMAKKQYGQARNVYTASIQMSLVLTVPLAVILFFTSPLLAQEVFKAPQITSYLQMFAVALPAFSLINVLSGILRALKRTRAALVAERMVTYIAALLTMLLLGGVLGLDVVVTGFTVGIFLALVLAVLIIEKHLPRAKEVMLLTRGQIMKTAWPLLFVVFATQMIGQVSVLLLGAYAGSSEVGIFNIALKVSLLISLVLTAINVIAGTKTSELYFQGKKDALAKIMGKTSALGTTFALPILAFMLLFPNFLLSLFGDEFVVGAFALVILAIGQFINVAVGSTASSLAMTGHEKPLALVIGLSLVANIVLGLILIPSYGATGAAIATASTIAASNIAMVLMTKHYLDIWQLPFRTFGVWFTKLKQPGRG